MHTTLATLHPELANGHNIRQLPLLQLLITCVLFKFFGAHHLIYVHSKGLSCSLGLFDEYNLEHVARITTKPPISLMTFITQET